MSTNESYPRPRYGQGQPIAGGGGVYGAPYMDFGHSGGAQGISPGHQRHHSNPDHMHHQGSGFYGVPTSTPLQLVQTPALQYSIPGPRNDQAPSMEGHRMNSLDSASQEIRYVYSPPVGPVGDASLRPVGRSFEVANPYLEARPHFPFGQPLSHHLSLPPNQDANHVLGSGVYPLNISLNQNQNSDAMSTGTNSIWAMIAGASPTPTSGGGILGPTSSVNSSQSAHTQVGSTSDRPLVHQGSVASTDSGGHGMPLRRRALLIGCNYEGNNKQATLQGCVQDVRNMRYFLITNFGFKEDEICVMTDDPNDGGLMPTRRNILERMEWLVKDATRGTSLVFHFAGHGIQVKCTGGDEDDGLDECIVPSDCQSPCDGIVDNLMNEMLVRPLTEGVVLHAIIDSCHSGTVLDLNYRLKSQGHWERTKTMDGRDVIGKDTSGGRAIQFGACRDNQNALDTQEMHGNVHTGAATYAFIHAFEVDQKYTYGAVLSHMVKKLGEKTNDKGKSIQTPQLCCNTDRLMLSQRIVL